ncbi:PAS domain S-box protein [Deinococcus misasensis]|uniref:PAS domain S-box protein n=1 Tax=Deinococcus misasensis TaxID=392413 RepID=UPI00069105E6|nr:PAS domain S-box protein [Deinococcus misasensis]
MTSKGLQADCDLIQVLNMLPHPTCLLDPHAHPEFNRLWENLLGAVPFEALDAEGAALCWSRQKDVQEMQNAVQRQVQVTLKNGSLQKALLSLERLPDAPRCWMGTLILLHESPEQPMPPELLTGQEDTIAVLNAILENAPMGIGLFGPDLKLRGVNAKLAEHNHLPAADHLGKSWQDLYPEQSEHLMAAQQHVLSSGMPILNIEVSTESMTGPVQHHLISYFPVKTSAGHILGVGTIVQDITTEQQAREALRTSEHFLKHITDTVPALVYIFDLDHNRIRYVNPEFSAATGLTLRDLQHMDAQDLVFTIHPEDQNHMQAQGTRLLQLQDGETQIAEFRVRNREGDWVWLHAIQTVFSRHPDGTPASLLGAALDITERKKTEMALQESERRFQLVANHAPVMVWMADFQYGASFFNTSWLDFRGRSLKQELGEGWHEGIHPEDRLRCENTFLEAHHHGTAFTLEYRLKRFDGVYRWIVDRGVPRFTETGEFKGFIGASIDIHDRKLAETVLQDSEKRLRELMDAQKRFVADAAHELRTPLTAIQGNLDILVRYADIPEEEKLEIITDVQKEATRLGRLVHDMLQLARGDSGASLREESLDLGRLVLDTFRETERVFSSHRFVLDRVQSLPFTGDADRLKQLLLILLENALKYTPEQGEIHLSLEKQEGFALLKVQDTGMGIHEEDLERVFERFFRADKSRHRTQDPGGTGLGLPIAKWIVEAHKGKIWLESQVDQGTTVHVRLPIHSMEL